MNDDTMKPKQRTAARGGGSAKKRERSTAFCIDDGPAKPSEIVLPHPDIRKIKAACRIIKRKRSYEDDGYDGSNSSNTNNAAPFSSSCSSSEYCFEEEQRQLPCYPKVRSLLRKKRLKVILSDDIADFSSGLESLDGDDDDSAINKNPLLGDIPSELLSKCSLIQGRAPALSLDCAVMAHVLTFLEPPEILDTLTAPISKDWVATYTRQPELWRVLCLLDPFKANVEQEEEGFVNDDDEEDDDGMLMLTKTPNARRDFGHFRVLYTSFVRCMRYLLRIKDDAENGRPLTIINPTPESRSIASNENLQRFFSRARDVVTQPASALAKSDKTAAAEEPPKKKVSFGHSKLTQRLLGPTAAGVIGEVELPWQCGIYSIVNWMTAFADVEGIQIMCLRVLPYLLENEQQRITAQRAGLTDVVLRAMMVFPDSTPLHTAAFHTIVLVARPLGGQEGMLFHTTMVHSAGIFGSAAEGAAGGKSGIAVLLDSMRRFENDAELQAMACWSLVNIALSSRQKDVLIKLGGVDVTMNAMTLHSSNPEVQFRALFALINLVIPVTAAAPRQQQPNAPPPPVASDASSEDDLPERESLDVEQIVGLVVASMKKFCSNEAILNRACLVLYNLSLTTHFHAQMLWSTDCYQMLEWCLAHYRTDQVLQQSAAGTLSRLQGTLNSNPNLRSRFAALIRTQQRQRLAAAHREAAQLQEQAQGK